MQYNTVQTEILVGIMVGHSVVHTEGVRLYAFAALTVCYFDLELSSCFSPMCMYKEVGLSVYCHCQKARTF